jgi:hypothetical protein
MVRFWHNEARFVPASPRPVATAQTPTDTRHAPAAQRTPTHDDSRDDSRNDPQSYRTAMFAFLSVLLEAPLTYIQPRAE